MFPVLFLLWGGGGGVLPLCLVMVAIPIATLGIVCSVRLVYSSRTLHAASLPTLSSFNVIIRLRSPLTTVPLRQGRRGAKRRRGWIKLRSPLTAHRSSLNVPRSSLTAHRSSLNVHRKSTLNFKRYSPPLTRSRLSP